MSVPRHRTLAGRRRSERRRVRRLPPRPRTLIVTNGQLTERQYAEWVKQHVADARVPITIQVFRAEPVALYRQALRAAGLEGSSGGPKYDHVWIVFDVDDQAVSITSLQQGRGPRSVHLIVSNLCFEVWLLFHVSGSLRHLTAGEAEQAVARLHVVDGREHKRILTKTISGRFTIAEKRAAQARNRHTTLGARFPEDNPSSTVDVMVRSIINTARAAYPQLNTGSL